MNLYQMKCMFDMIGNTIVYQQFLNYEKVQFRMLAVSLSQASMLVS